MACYQDNLLWMAALWDMSSGNFFPGQDWQFGAGDTRSCWDLAVQQEAEVCLVGLLNMSSFYAAEQARNPESSVPWGDGFRFRTAFMTEWCRRVARGAMPHGALLAHSRLTGHALVVKPEGHTEPEECVDWQDHGRDGVAAVRGILLQLGFYPQMAETVEGKKPPAVASKADRNRAKMKAGFATVEWDQLTIIRGVEFWLDDETMAETYTWDVVRGGPTPADVQCPVRSGELRPGEYNVTYYQQVKGHWLWAIYRDESGSLTVKWVRGLCPPGGKRWLHKKAVTTNIRTIVTTITAEQS